MDWRFPDIFQAVNVRRALPRPLRPAAWWPRRSPSPSSPPSLPCRSQRAWSTRQSWRLRWAWAGAGALSMGGGIWAMHFIGMLAFSLPCGISYDPLGTMLSMIPGHHRQRGCTAASSAASAIPGLARLLAGGVLIGAGIGAMHYAGMAAMQPRGRAPLSAGSCRRLGGRRRGARLRRIGGTLPASAFRDVRHDGNPHRRNILGARRPPACTTPPCPPPSVFYPLSSGCMKSQTIMPPTLLAALDRGRSRY